MAAQDTRLLAPVGAVVGAWAILLGGWVAAGSLGLIADPLRTVLTWLAMAIAAIAVRPRLPEPASVRKVLLGVTPALLAVLAALVLPVVLRTGPAYQVFFVALVAVLLAAGTTGATRTILRSTATAVFCLGLFRLAAGSSARLWMLTDTVSAGLSGIAGAVSGRSLWVGPTFAGVELLVATIALATVSLAVAPGRRWFRCLVALAAICGAHLCYLAMLAWTHDLAAALPEVATPPRPEIYVPPAWSLINGVRSLLPWSVPLAGAAFHSVVALAILRWTPWPDNAVSEDAPACSVWRRDLRTWGPVVLAGLIPMLMLFCPAKSVLTGKKIVAYGQGYLNWEVPVHGRYGQFSAGGCGMLPQFIQSLGGEFELMPDLASPALDDADLLLLLHPVDRWTEQQRQRIWGFVRGGGSLLVVAGPRVQDGKIDSTFNQILQPTAIRVREDVAISRTPGWQNGCDVLANPVSIGVDSSRPWFGHLETSSLAVRWPARPLLVGRWGWSDPGSDAVLTQQARFEAGERLGDLVLAACQRIGRGRVVVLGDPVCLTNLGNVTQYPLTGRLLATLANPSDAIDPQIWWRQSLGIVFCVGLLVLLGPGPTPRRLAIAAGVLMLSGALCVSVNFAESRVVPNGRLIAKSETGLASAVAYVDASHVAAYRDEQWAFDGIGGFWLTLMRNGFLPLEMHELTRDRLDRAGMLVCIGPARPYGRSQRSQLDRFVRNGGVLILAVGAEEAPASRELLAQFGLSVPHSPVPTGDPNPEPEPMGNFATAYLNAADYGRGDYQLEVLVYTGWPVAGTADVELNTMGWVKQPTITTLDGQEQEVEYKEQPLVISRRYGTGRVVLIGDTSFCLNKNLEYATGESFRGRYENAQYWRWLISRVTGRAEWIPPEPPPEQVSDPTVEEEPSP